MSYTPSHTGVSELPVGVYLTSNVAKNQLLKKAPKLNQRDVRERLFVAWAPLADFLRAKILLEPDVLHVVHNVTRGSVVGFVGLSAMDFGGGRRKGLRTHVLGQTWPA